MFSTLTRTVFVVVGLLAAAVETFAGNYSIAALFAFAAALLVYGHFRYGTVAVAFRAYQRGSLDDVAAHLAAIRHPTFLAPKTRAYYELLKGVLAHRDGAFDDARVHLGAALDGGLRTTHMVAVVHVHLADVALQSADRGAALAHIDAARSAPHKPALDAAIDALAEQARD